jgi:hypothetical protein
VRAAWGTATIARMTEGSERQRRIGIANEVRRRTGEVETFALAWTNDADVVARFQRGRRFEYQTFVLDDGTVERIVAWVHADNPRTS